MYLISIEGKQNIRNTSISCNKLENCKEYFLEVEIKIRLKVTESDRRFEQH